MAIEITGAGENNLKDVDAHFSNGLTVVTGVSGSGKSSLVFDTLHREGKNRFDEAFGTTPGEPEPVIVRGIDGLGPVVSLEQNTLNRNPNSTLATASGLHPFFRLLYSRFGRSHCPRCGIPVDRTQKPVLIKRISRMNEKAAVSLGVPLLRDVPGSHRSLLALLNEEYPRESLLLDNCPGRDSFDDYSAPHSLEIRHWHIPIGSEISQVIRTVEEALSLGCPVVNVYQGEKKKILALSDICPECGMIIPEISSRLFNLRCDNCRGAGCVECGGSGLHPTAASVLWEGSNMADLLGKTAEEARALFAASADISERLNGEIGKRLEILCESGLGYVTLDRSVPSLSRGEAQRLRLSVSLAGRLEDLVHILDEPTIGQHPWNVRNIIPQFGKLPGPVIFVEHDMTAAAMADWALDIGPGAGSHGGEVMYNGEFSELAAADSPTGQALREGPAPVGAACSINKALSRQEEDALSFRACSARNLLGIDISLYPGELTVITGVSGSGKSTLFEEVIHKSLKEKQAVNCREMTYGPSWGKFPEGVLVDQDPIGKNPRSNPGTYTKLADALRDLLALKSGEPAGLFSFNTPLGRCPVCTGMGAREVKMHYLPSFWETCESCGGKRFNDRALGQTFSLGDKILGVDDIYHMPLGELGDVLSGVDDWPGKKKALTILDSLLDSGLSYLSLGQPSPTLSGGEAQRIKLARYLSRRRLKGTVFLLDEPSSGLHSADIGGLLHVFSHLTQAGAAVVIIEHNTAIIRKADRVIDLGPHAGPDGGKLVYQGNLSGLIEWGESLTGEALREEEKALGKIPGPPVRSSCPVIDIKGARANNLRSLSLEIPKGKLTVLAGVSGSGKSSLLHNILEREARRRYLESLSLYERQGIRESAEPEADSLTGLGVTALVSPGRRLFNPRSTVGSQTELTRHLAVLFSLRGKAPGGGTFEPRHFLPGNYGSSCPACNGLGNRRVPNPDKLIIHRDKPVCKGAMFSPGFFPQGYLGKPYNGGYYIIQALGRSYGFDPHETPWQDMSEEARQAFLFGTDRVLDVRYENKKGEIHPRRQSYEGFYGSWVGEWDLGGTYTDIETCEDCHGSGFAEPYRSVTLGGQTHHMLYSMDLANLHKVMRGLPASAGPGSEALKILERRLGFLCRVGLGYIALNRQTATLSAGEAMRIRLSSLLGSRLTNLTVLLDEPTRGLHPSEVEGLLIALEELRDGGNTVVMVEHDPDCLLRADHLIELGPGGGSRGGEIVCQGNPATLSCPDSPTLERLKNRAVHLPAAGNSPRSPRGYMVLKGASGNNLKGDEFRLPLGMLTGVCGVSGSGKSSLVMDTIGRICAPKKHTTSMAQELMEPGEYRRLEGAPDKVFILDQSRKGFRSPGDFLGVSPRLEILFAVEEGREKGAFKKRCPQCRGRGIIREDMDFLPPMEKECEACNGTGIPPELHQTELLGCSLPELLGMTLEDLLDLFSRTGDPLEDILEKACRFGLGYLSCRQPGVTLSGGEIQRLKIIKEILKKKSTSPKSKSPTPSQSGALYLLDEPTVGLHMADTEKLALALEELVERGHTVVVVEHNIQLLALCDHVIELGPLGGPGGGKIIYQGPPESMAGTPTAPYLQSQLTKRGEA